MAVFSVIKLSGLEGAKRFSAEFYKPHFLRIKHNLIKLGAKLLKNYITLLYRYPTFYNLEYRKEGVLVLKGEDIVQEGFVQNQSQDYISLEDASCFPKTIVEEGDLIISVRGYVGKIGIIDKKYVSSIISANLIRAKISGLSSYFVWVFLNSKYGSSQLDRIKMMTSQETVVADDIRNLLIFEPSKNFQEKIETLSISAINQVRKSEYLYSQAENLLLEELGLKDFKPKNEKTYTANLSDAFSVHRIDAEYFQPAFKEVEEYIIKNYSAKPIKKLNFVEVTTGQYSEKYVDKSEGMPYIRGTDLKNGTINTDNLVYISPEDQIESKKAKEGDVVVTRVGTIGLAARIPKECEGGTISDNLIRLRFDQQKLNSYYLALFLGSPLGVNLMIKNSRGSVQQRLNQETLKEVIVPLLPLSTQKEIASLVQQSHEARRKAKELLEAAKRAVEIAIEQSEENAMSFLKFFERVF